MGAESREDVCRDDGEATRVHFVPCDLRVPHEEGGVVAKHRDAAGTLMLYISTS